MVSQYNKKFKLMENKGQLREQRSCWCAKLISMYFKILNVYERFGLFLSHLQRLMLVQYTYNQNVDHRP